MDSDEKKKSNDGDIFKLLIKPMFSDVRMGPMLLVQALIALAYLPGNSF